MVLNNLVHSSFADAAVICALRPNLHDRSQGTGAKATRPRGEGAIARCSERQTFLLVAQMAPDDSRPRGMARATETDQNASLLSRHNRGWRAMGYFFRHWQGLTAGLHDSGQHSRHRRMISKERPDPDFVTQRLREYDASTLDSVPIDDRESLISGYELAARGFLRYFETHGLIGPGAH